MGIWSLPQPEPEPEQPELEPSLEPARARSSPLVRKVAQQDETTQSDGDYDGEFDDLPEANVNDVYR